MLKQLRSVCVAFALALSAAPILSASPASAGPIDGSSCDSWVRIVDISSYQPNVDWGQVARDGIAGVYIKTTEGNWYISPTFASQKAGAASVGLPWGGYDYARTEVNAQVDAQYFVAAGGASGTLPPMLDLEQSTLDANWTALWARQWSDAVFALTGRNPVTLYTGAFYPWSYNASLASLSPLFISAYPWGYTPVSSACGLSQPSTAAWSGWSVWQFTSSANMPGIGTVDLDAATPQWWAQATGASVTPPTSGTNRYPGATYTIGSSGSAVITIQTLLRNAGLYGGQIDGVYGQDTANAVYSWQVRLGVAADGVWGPGTQKATNDFLSWLASHPSHHKPKYGTPKFVKACEKKVLVQGNHGLCVRYAQKMLQKRGWPIARDGHFGSQTALAVLNFKTTHGLKKNSRIGKKTWKALV